MQATRRQQSIQLYPFQQIGYNAIREAWKTYDRVVFQLPTGGGKTEVAIEAIIDIYLNTDEFIVILAPTEVLRSQWAERLRHYGIRAEVVEPGDKNVWPSGIIPLHRVIVCTPQTYMRRLTHHPETVLYDTRLIVDEMHHYGGKSSWALIIAVHQGKILGLSATPERTHPDEAFPAWQYLIQGPQTRDLIREGYLCDYSLYNIQGILQRKPVLGANIEKILGIKKSGRQNRSFDYDSYDSTKLWKQARKEPQSALTRKAFDIWYEWARDRKTIVFALTIDHANYLKQVWNENGFQADVIVAATSSKELADRREAIKRFASTPNGVLFTVNVLREGFDVPDADCLLDLRPTDSIALHRQKAGRVLRRGENKHALILDLTDNVDRMGLPDEPRNWSIHKLPMEEGEGKAPTKACRGMPVLDKDGYIIAPGDKGCYALNPTSSHNCKGCGLSFGKVCNVEQDGCGKWRAWRWWGGELKQFRPGTCMPCGRIARQIALNDRGLGFETDLERLQQAGYHHEIKNGVDELKQRIGAVWVTIQRTSNMKRWRLIVEMDKIYQNVNSTMNRKRLARRNRMKLYEVQTEMHTLVRRRTKTYRSPGDAELAGLHYIASLWQRYSKLMLALEKHLGKKK